MLINLVPGEESGFSEVGWGGGGAQDDPDDASHEYRTASELFDLMANNQNLQLNEDESLSTRDLVLLYKNIDLGTKLMSDASELKNKTPNQYVETIVYEELDSDSDLSEIYSSEDIHNVVLVNKERIELLNHPPSLENSLCHKLGDLEIPTSQLSIDYNKKFVFKNAFKKDQLNSLNLISTAGFGGTVLPASLLDYICCKSLEDNYNFYMENIIRYVKHTIDQLKRISNGDYLTDKAKEKWKEVFDDKAIPTCDVIHTKIVSKSTTIPLYVDRKTNEHVTKWDDLVHSDIRSLSKMFEKKIVVEVHKAIYGSYKLFSKCCNDNLIISGKKEIPEKVKESRVDIVLQLDRSDSGHVISNISSIMILQKKPENTTNVLALPYNGNVILVPKKNVKENKITIIELQADQDYTDIEEHTPAEENSNPSLTPRAPKDNQSCPCDLEVVSYKCSSILSNVEMACSSDSNYGKCDEKLTTHAANNAPDELKLTIQRLDMQTALSEEEFSECTLSINTSINKKKSPTRNRIKSPYENKSHLLEEKKRKKFLEIRQRREKKKLTLTEKVNKHKFAKGVVSPHNASSITKLSITNKSFYDSIYGQPGSTEHKQSKTIGRKERNDSIPEYLSENEESKSPLPQPDLNNQKYINKTCYLDNPVTEMMYMKIKENEQKEINNNTQEQFSDMSSAVSTDRKTNFKIFTQIITPPAIEISEARASSKRIQKLGEVVKNIEENESHIGKQAFYLVGENKIPENAPTDATDKTLLHVEKEESKKVNASAEFRKSIDKIYELINKLGKGEGAETKLFKSKFTTVAERANIIGGGAMSTILCSDSGTSVKHHLNSLNPSYYSFEKANSEDTTKSKIFNTKKLTHMTPLSIVPKVIISTKTSQAENPEKDEKVKKDGKKSSPNKFNTDNPLRAISQLLHEFDNVQKIRSKTSATETKVIKKQEVSFTDTKVESRQVVKRSSRFENYLKDKEPPERNHRPNAPRERRTKQPHLMEPSKFLTQSNHAEVKPCNRVLKKKVVDIVDELKEARGEAVRGPSKPNSRLNSLAQPKKTYVQAQIEDFQTRYGKSFVTDRLQKLTKSPPGQALEKTATPKQKRKNDGTPTTKLSHSPPPVLERFPKKQSNINNREIIPLRTKNQISKKLNVVDAPDSLKKKMVEVESYVKNHYGRTSTASTNDLFSDGQKSRVPFFPNDFDLLSFASSHVEVSSTLGNKIHDIIHTMIPTPLSSALTTEQAEASRSSQDIKKVDEKSIQEVLNVESEENKYGVDYNVVFTRDNRTQMVNLRRDDIIGDTIPEENESYTQLTSQNSLTEHTKLKKSLHMCVEPIQKCLELRNLTCAPKESMHQVLLLQAGDANSVLLKSALSQNMKNTSNIKELGILPELSNFDLNFTQLPMQIATVGYSFPQFQHTDPKSNSVCFTNRSITTVSSRETNSGTTKSDKTSQCFKGGQTDALSKSESQVYLKEIIDISSILKSSSTNIRDRNKLSTPNNNKLETDSAHYVNKLDAVATTEPLSLTETSTEMSQVTLSVKNDKNIDEENNKDNKEHKVEDMKETPTPRIEYTTSLDILAGLLNEIQKITTCQTKITNEADQGTGQQHLELETVLKSAVTLNNVQEEVRNIISITSLDKLRHLESNQSIYSLYLSSNCEKDFMDSKFANLKPLYADKEVDAIRPAIEYVNRCTDVPSRFFPMTVNHATDVSNSLFGILSAPSSQSVYAFNEYPLHRNASLTSLKIIKYPKNESAKEIKEKSIETKKLSNDNTKNLFVIPTSKKQSCKTKYRAINSGLEPVLGMKRNDSDLDPMIKMKRDILVTMYSVLVLTVFAALSFPEMYRA